MIIIQYEISVLFNSSPAPIRQPCLVIGSKYILALGISLKIFCGHTGCTINDQSFIWDWVFLLFCIMRYYWEYGTFSVSAWPLGMHLPINIAPPNPWGFVQGILVHPHTGCFFREYSIKSRLCSSYFLWIIMNLILFIYWLNRCTYLLIRDLFQEVKL